jgi:hypothetical protein
MIRVWIAAFARMTVGAVYAVHDTFPQTCQESAMPLKTYTCAEVSIPHADMLSLQKAGDLTLGIGNANAETIARTRALWPQFITFKPATGLRNWIAVAVFGLSIYLSFVDEWWHIAYGLAFMLMLGKNYKKLNIEKILAAAEFDPAFYEAQREAGTWMYRIDEEKASPFLNLSK